MKKVLFLSILMNVIFGAFTNVFAYNPPVGANQIYKYSSPTAISQGNSASGQGIFNATPESIAFNPALTAFEQRIQLDADFSALISNNDNSAPFNSSFLTGIMIPLKFGVFTGIVNGTFINCSQMDLGNSFNLKAGLSKEVTKNISVGINISGGFFWESTSDWSLGADLGALYRRENLGFLKDFRIGLGILNLGKPYKSELKGIKESESSDFFPSIATLKLGTSFILVDFKDLKLGASVGATIPTFQNAIFDFGLQFGIKDLIFINVAENLDIAELSNGHNDFIPAVGVSVKFLFNSTKNEYLKKHDWDKSEFTASVAYKNQYENVNAISGGLNIKLGLQDENPPVIELW